MRLLRLSTPSEPQRDARFFEQYKLAVEMADRHSARRATANAFFATLNAALLTAVGLLREPQAEGEPLTFANQFAPALGVIAGIVLCVVWFFMLRTYRHLSSAKWEVILAMEKSLPYPLFDEEWRKLPHDVVRRRDRYLPLTEIEKRIPWVFVAIYVLTFGVFAWPLLQQWGWVN
jgi:hypothetical protein